MYCKGIHLQSILSNFASRNSDIVIKTTNLGDVIGPVILDIIRLVIFLYNTCRMGWFCRMLYVISHCFLWDKSIILIGHAQNIITKISLFWLWFSSSVIGRNAIQRIYGHAIPVIIFSIMLKTVKWEAYIALTKKSTRTIFCNCECIISKPQEVAF